MRQMRKIARSARKLKRGQFIEVESADVAEQFPILRMGLAGARSTQESKQQHQAVEDSLVEIFDNVVSFVVRELQELESTADDIITETPKETSDNRMPTIDLFPAPADRRKTLL
ncbi:MAG: hypothetical protein VKJ04_07450 [Vampirovibrionales bacterium]|nr:hypothetical protein [Vampirovibrionales bacterium]